ncbi:MAG: DUF1015 domain-containing protein [Bacillus subtilis]|nr:DUF1015 domain-containing protein [Bacillus subtilis]
MLERIPPRLKIRENAGVELPHTLIFWSTIPRNQIIESTLRSKKRQFQKVYDFELNQNGGHLTRLSDQRYRQPVIRRFLQPLERSPAIFQFVVGDGNHSLATAKAHWEKIEANAIAQEQAQSSRPLLARRSRSTSTTKASTFEAIHRVVFNADDDFMPGLRRILKGDAYEGMIYTSRTGSKSIR